ncbi:hypothetical protein BH09ACT7_BH09ACT7_01570 [soil metagenome]
MARTAPATADTATGEAFSSLGLILSVITVISLAVGLAGLTLGQAVFAAAGGATMVVSFAGSMACFIADTRRYELQTA